MRARRRKYSLPRRRGPCARDNHRAPSAEPPFNDLTRLGRTARLRRLGALLRPAARTGRDVHIHRPSPGADLMFAWGLAGSGWGQQMPRSAKGVFTTIRFMRTTLMVGGRHRPWHGRDALRIDSIPSPPPGAQRNACVHLHLYTVRMRGSSRRLRAAYRVRTAATRSYRSSAERMATRQPCERAAARCSRLEARVAAGPPFADAVTGVVDGASDPAVSQRSCQCRRLRQASRGG